MANTTTEVLPKLLAQGLLALRQNCVMPRLVNRSYDNIAAQKGAVINVPIPSALAAYDIAPTVTLLANVDSAPTVAQVTLDFWKGAKFHLTDKEMQEVMDGTIPMQASEAVKSLGNAVDTYILSKHVGFYGASGAAGTTPFNASLTAAANARKLLNKQLAPMENRFAVIDPDAETNLLLNTNILQVDQSGSDAAIVKGAIGEKLGFQWHLDQNVSTYTPGTGWATGFAASTVAGSIGDVTLNVLNATASGSIKIGDIFTIGGGTQQYVVTVTTTVSATVQVAIRFYPPLVSAAATGVALTVIGTAYVHNLAFHRDAIAWASRPMSDVPSAGNEFMSQVDPVSGVALRLEISRQNKQTTFEYDILGGANVVRREFGVKILG